MAYRNGQQNRRTFQGTLDFDFDHVKDIGCPMSLIYRLSRDFYIGQDSFYTMYITVSSTDYSNTIRNFILTRLRGRVTDMDFKSLEAMIYGRQFSLISQRMWAFRIFREQNVPRMDCQRWFTAWQTLGYDYDITLFSNWQYTFSFSIDQAVQAPVVLPASQMCLLEYEQRFGNDNQNLIIENFSKFDGTFASLPNVFVDENYEYLFRPEMDAYLLKFHIFQNYPQEEF